VSSRETAYSGRGVGSSALCAPREMLASGIPDLDALIGGFPRGSITEIVGPESSGRTTLANTLLAAATARGEICCHIDTSDAFDPVSAAQAGTVLSQLIWVRCGGNAEHAFKAADAILHAGGFGVVLLDLGAARPIADRGVGTAIGTPGYAAPEQYQGIADQQTDLYGLGGTLRFACTGYDAERDGSTQLPQVQERQIGISPELRWLIGSLLELGSRDRPGTAAGVLAYIESLEDLSNARLEQTVCQGAIRRLLVGVPSLTGLAAIFLGAHRLSGTWPPDKLLWFLPAVLVVALDTVATPWVGMRSTSGALGAARRKTTRDLQWPFRIAFGSAVVLAWPGANLGVIPGAWFAVFALVVIILAVLLVRLHAASSRYATIRAAVFIEPRATPQITAPGMLPSA